MEWPTYLLGGSVLSPIGLEVRVSAHNFKNRAKRKPAGGTLI